MGCQNDVMRFKTGLLAGFAAGYYLGAKAGRERYEQIRRALRKLAGSEPVRAVVAKAQEAVDRPRNAARSRMEHGLRVVSEKLRGAADG